MKPLVIPADAPRVPSEIFLHRQWDATRVRDLIAKKSGLGRQPAFLFLGKKEAALLREHLGEAFGAESVASLKDLYYLNMEIIELETPTFFRTAGLKRMGNFLRRQGRAPRWKDIEHGSFWGLSF